MFPLKLKLAALTSLLIFAASSPVHAQQKKSLKELEQQAKSNFAADQQRKRQLEAEAAFATANSAYQREDFVTAVNFLKISSSAGIAAAQYNLAIFYIKGTGVSKNTPEAVRLLKLAAGQGLAEAMIKLGELYETGVGIAKDGAEALRWYEAAAKSGSVLGRANFSFFLSKGLAGRARDPARAKEILLELSNDKTILMSFPEPKYSVFMAEVLYNLGELQYAGADFGIQTDEAAAKTTWERVKPSPFLPTTEQAYRRAKAGLACISDGFSAALCKSLRCSIEATPDTGSCPDIAESEMISRAEQEAAEQRKIKNLSGEATLSVRMKRDQPNLDDYFYTELWKDNSKAGSVVVETCIDGRRQRLETKILQSSGDLKIDGRAINYGRALYLDPAQGSGQQYADKSCYQLRINKPN